MKCRPFILIVQIVLLISGVAAQADNVIQANKFPEQSVGASLAVDDSAAVTGTKLNDWKDSSASCSSYRGRINILDCGADHTNTRDNTSAIRLALSKATRQDEIYFPSGTYRVDGDIKLPEINKKISIVGESRGIGGRRNQPASGTIINYTGIGTLFESDDPGNIGNSKVQDASMLSLEVRDITLQGSTLSDKSIGMNLDAMNHVNLTRVRFKGFYKGTVGVTVAGRAAYSIHFEDVDYRSYGTEDYPNAEYGTYHLMDTAIQIGAYGGNPLWAGHITMNKVHTEQVRAGLVLISVSNVTTEGFTVDTSCSAIEGYGVEFSTFMNSYLDANPSHATLPFHGCGTHTSGKRITLVGGRGNVIWPTACDGCGADPKFPDRIQPETTTVLSPAGSEDKDTITKFSGEAMKLGDKMNLYLANGKGLKSYLPGLIKLSATPYTSVSGSSITFAAANTLGVGQWVAFSAIDAPTWMRTYYYYYVMASDASSFTLYVPYAADGKRGTANGSAYYDSAKISILRTTQSKSIVLGDFDNRWQVNVIGAAISLDGESVNLQAPTFISTSARSPFTITSKSAESGTSSMLCSGITFGNNCSWLIGQGPSINNSYYTRFHYQANGASSNFVSGGFNGGNDLWSLFANGNMFLGSSAMDNGYKLEVNGSGRFNGALTATSGTVANYLSAWQPEMVPPSTCAEQQLRVNGLETSRAVMVSPPAALSHVWIGSTRVSGLGVLAVQFCADSSGGTPPSGNWLVTQ